MKPTPRSTRRTAAIATALSAVVLSASGCATGAAETEADTFSLSYPAAENSPYAKMAEAYMDTYPDASITLEPIPSENYDELLRTQLQGGSASDIIMATPGSGAAIALLSLADAGLIAPLDDTSEAAIDPASEALFTKDGMAYGQPTDTSVTALVYETTAGVPFPQDYDELLATCASTRDDGTSLFAVAGSIPINAGLVAIVMAAPNVYAQNPDWDAQRAAGEVSFADTEGWRTTLEQILALSDAGCFQDGVQGAGFDAIVNGLARGTSLAAFLPGGVATDMAEPLGTKELAVEAFPGASTGEEWLFASSDYALAISADSTNTEAAQDYLSWLAEPEQAQQYAELAGTLPTTGIDGIDLTDTTYAPVADLLEAERYSTLPANAWPNPDVYSTMGSGVQGLLTGQKTVDDVLAELDEAWES